MASREEFQSFLESLLGSNAVYFQPPSTVQMRYPCLVYERNSARTKSANNKPYFWMFQYTVTLIDRNPDSPIIPKLMALPLCAFNRHFTKDNLNHDVFELFY